MKRILLLALLAAGAAVAGAGAAQPGDVVGDLPVATLDAGTLTLASEAAAHRALVIVFLSTTCPYSAFYEDRLPAIAAAYAARGIGFLGVYPNASETSADIRSRLRQKAIGFPVSRDPDLKLTKAFGAVRTPEVFVLDAQRRLRYRGQLGSKFGSPLLANALDALLAGREVPSRVTKAFGCAIEGL